MIIQLFDIIAIVIVTNTFLRWGAGKFQVSTVEADELVGAIGNCRWIQQFCQNDLSNWWPGDTWYFYLSDIFICKCFSLHPCQGFDDVIASGGWHTCAIRESGEVSCWGANDHGQRLGCNSRPPAVDQWMSQLPAVEVESSQGPLQWPCFWESPQLWSTSWWSSGMLG